MISEGAVEELSDLKKTKHQQQQQQQTTLRAINDDNHEDDEEEEEENDDESKGSNKEASSTTIEDEDEEGEFGNGNVMMRPIRKRRFRSMEFIYRSTEPLVKLAVSHDNAYYKKRIKCNY
ncbi:hypothetical protein Ddye_003218 [Dipteronia dyeriana]|uniref:Uncharacterized protein n=1 Tax=Dipteronia dyeriana TaxID=168575 RepID=A0AAE0CV94_9ROSI|nr:hypothetical protein Ddye_003218 [Dipteronia dyeriana]